MALRSRRTSAALVSGANLPAAPTVHWTSRSFLPARMSIQAAAIFFPSLLTATAGASMGQLSTLLSPWLIRATREKDAPVAISKARFAFFASLAPDQRGGAFASTVRPGAQHSHSGPGMIWFLPIFFPWSVILTHARS